MIPAGGDRMLKRFVSAMAVVGLFLVHAGCAQAPVPQSTGADEAKLKTDAEVWFDFYAKADADGLASLYSEDAILMPPGAPAVTGRAGIRAFLGDDSKKSKEAGLSIKDTGVTGAGVSGDFGWISGKYTLVDTKGTTIDSGNYMSVHHRTNGTWLYIRDTWNSDRPVPAPDVKRD
jgi:ketosteroid isomerase-like protein